MVVDVGGADAFVDVLGGEVVAQHFGGARVAVFAAQTVKQGGTALVEGGDDAGVAHGEVDVAVAYPGCLIGVEEVGFGFEVAAECFVGVGDAFLDGRWGRMIWNRMMAVLYSTVPHKIMKGLVSQ
ncbi:Uncharacterised protein [Neisseria gonorrhoeae]|uniref:Uncharacterized protein n=1 Tax=Neisseria gonorrhoeae TaxID=485 RepID=A0A378W494_NEIGO|nr:Uncharacterised protein [Neisseria gonorrhoeae]